jgi:hypothetical protein
LNKGCVVVPFDGELKNVILGGDTNVLYPGIVFIDVKLSTFFCGFITIPCSEFM